MRTHSKFTGLQGRLVGRRGFIAGAVGFSLLPAVARAQSAMSAFVAPGAGGEGSSLQNPASIERIDDLIQLVGPGGTVYVLADAGEYNLRGAIRIEHGGGPGAPVSIIGVKADLTPQQAVFIGDRQKWERPESEAGAVNAEQFGGGNVFEFGRDASHLYISNLAFQHCGRLFDFTDITLSDLTFEDIGFYNIRDGIFTTENSEISEVVIRRFSGVGFSKKAIRFHGRCYNWLIEDCELDSAWQFGDRFAVGIQCYDTAHDLVVRGGYTINSLDMGTGEEGSYWNADGMAAELGNYNLHIENHYSAGHSDGGYDLKSEGVTFLNVVAEDNKRNYRLWGGKGTVPIRLDNCISRNPNRRGGSGDPFHVWTLGEREEGEVGAASLLFVGGSFEGGADDMVAIMAEGRNAIVHLVDVDIEKVVAEELFRNEDPSSVLIQGSLSDPPMTEITTPEELTAVAGLVNGIILHADTNASWRRVEQVGGPPVEVRGNKLRVISDAIGDTAEVTVLARDTRGDSLTKTFLVSVIDNPVAPNVSLFAVFDGPDGGTEVADQTAINELVFNGSAAIAGNALRFDGGDNYVSVEDSENFSFSGPFTIDVEFKLDDVTRDQDQAIVSHWADRSRGKSFMLGVQTDGELFFAWSIDGAEAKTIVIPGVLENDTYYNIRVDRDEAGNIRVYRDGEMVGKENDPQPFRQSYAQLRLNGTMRGGAPGTGSIRSVMIVTGRALTGSDDGYQNEASIGAA